MVKVAHQCVNSHINLDPMEVRESAKPTCKQQGNLGFNFGDFGLDFVRGFVSFCLVVWGC